MSKHTPGPWLVRRWSWPTEVTGPIHQVISADRFPTAFVPAWDEPNPGEVEASEEAKANACLIAAAPELLEALRMFVVWYGLRDKHDTLLPPKMQEAELAQAMRAIAKATGEPA